MPVPSFVSRRSTFEALRLIPYDRIRLICRELEIQDGRKQQRVIQPDASFRRMSPDASS